MRLDSGALADRYQVARGKFWPHCSRSWIWRCGTLESGYRRCTCVSPNIRTQIGAASTRSCHCDFYTFFYCSVSSIVVVLCDRVRSLSRFVGDSLAGESGGFTLLPDMLGKAAQISYRGASVGDLENLGHTLKSCHCCLLRSQRCSTERALTRPDAGRCLG